MSISPGSDLILDVVNAVNPHKSAAASTRLAKLAAAPVVTGKDFIEELGKSAAKVGRKSIVIDAENKIPTHDNAVMPYRAGARNTSGDGALKKAYRQLEGVFLKGAVKSMLSGQKNKLFGESIAGEYWKSFMAEAIAEQVSRGKGLGVADALSQRARGVSAVGRSSGEMVLGNVKYEAELQKILLEKLERS